MRSTIMLLAPAVLAAATPALAQTAPTMVPDGTLLDVSAEGRTSRVPDVATIRAGVVTQGQTAAAALSENATRMTRVLAALRQAGVATHDVRTASVSLSPQYRYTDGQPPAVSGYQASNSVSIRLRDVAKSGSILDALVAQGANQIDGPTLSLDKPEAALDEARTDAVRIARSRAELYAKAAGLSVARIVTISENGANDGTAPQPPMYAMARVMKSSESTPIAAGETQVSVTVSVRFLLK
ncbi:SIMPL domain-containing protein [Sphingomonas sp. TREG-RG-20F-R18-01]|uniref:SIMPL domain-containing protein n=1 Tax=Sphingomonas sp. TREG-RG-20F-R18-01 TaxID=2914982 RepID=UPI001F575A17|nr:SIMPL domain-containing protein [Sphingomonas sp. TREG-RG-20F-R18-01]